MKTNTLTLGILALLVFGIILISGCVKEGTESQPPEDSEASPSSTQPAQPSRETPDSTQEIPSDVTQLTSLEYAIDPDWSSDGTKVVFCRMQGQTKTLYLINADGSGLTEIGPGFDPSWSPVEDKVAYELNKQIYIMNFKGEDITQLTTEHSNAQPTWNPDGTKIAYAHYGDEKPSIWIMNADGTGKTQLTTPADGECTFPSFSYDGSKIVYTKGPIWNLLSEKLPKAPNEIWIMNSDGSNKHQIYASSDTYQWIFQRAWNKNNEILFGTSPLQERKIPEIGIINPDGSNLRYILSPPKNSLGMPECIYLDPVWDDTGTKIAVTKQMIDGPTNIGTVSWKE